MKGGRGMSCHNLEKSGSCLLGFLIYILVTSGMITGCCWSTRFRTMMDGSWVPTRRLHESRPVLHHWIRWPHAWRPHHAPWGHHASRPHHPWMTHSRRSHTRHHRVSHHRCQTWLRRHGKTTWGHPHSPWDHPRWWPTPLHLSILLNSDGDW